MCSVAHKVAAHSTNTHTHPHTHSHQANGWICFRVFIAVGISCRGKHSHFVFSPRTPASSSNTLWFLSFSLGRHSSLAHHFFGIYKYLRNWQKWLWGNIFAAVPLNASKKASNSNFNKSHSFICVCDNDNNGRICFHASYSGYSFGIGIGNFAIVVGYLNAAWHIGREAWIVWLVAAVSPFNVRVCESAREREGGCLMCANAWTYLNMYSA